MQQIKAHLLSEPDLSCQGIRFLELCDGVMIQTKPRNTTSYFVRLFSLNRYMVWKQIRRYRIDLKDLGFQDLLTRPWAFHVGIKSTLLWRGTPSKEKNSVKIQIRPGLITRWAQPGAELYLTCFSGYRIILGHRKTLVQWGEGGLLPWEIWARFWNR